MKKFTSSFVCQECGYDTPQWLGKCPECGAWNSFKEIKIQNIEIKKSSVGVRPLGGEKDTPKTLRTISMADNERLPTGFSEMDGVLGGAAGKQGLVKGGVVLLAGDPGIGKSTLLLQIALNVSQETQETKGKKVLYVSGEESEEQIKMRAERLRGAQNNENLLLLSLSDTDRTVATIESAKQNLVVVDSIQTMESQNVAGFSGSVGQVRYSAMQYIRVAKSLNIPLVMVGHVTKEGMVAGPMVLSHMVDTVLFLEGEKFTSLRILRSLKNRFGPVDEVGIFSMDENGMQESANPEQIFMSTERGKTPGSVLVVTLEGTRPFLVELQALVVFSKLPYPRRIVSGVDGRRVELLLAVLQKHCKLPVETMDVFVNVAGGMKLSDPAIDLGICLAIFSSFKNIPLQSTVTMGEVGLLGELRNIPSLEKRVREAQKLGFKRVVTAKEYKTLSQVIESLGKVKR